MGVLLKPLPYKDADRIVVANISPPDFRDVKDSNHAFDHLAIWASNQYQVTINGETTQALGAVVSPRIFPDARRADPGPRVETGGRHAPAGCD